MRISYRPRWGGEWLASVLEEPLEDEPFELEGLTLDQHLDIVAEALRQGAWPGVPCLIEVIDEDGRPVVERAVWG